MKVRPEIVEDERDKALAKRRSKYPTEVDDWGTYKQLGPSCDMDENGDPKPPRIVKR